MLHPSLDALYTKFFFRDRPFFLFIAGAGGLSILSWLFLIINLDTFRPSDTEYITLHYKMIVGTDFIARWESIFLIPALAVFIVVCNTALARGMIHAHKPLARALSCAALITSAVLYMSLTLLYRINQ
ncbi:hypothetical protein HY623_04340 [Candidatus Uhrbacteria bacterium]|nr:hypothetical protein [Candidatus Uhrbacteria bacterium]